MHQVVLDQTLESEREAKEKMKRIFSTYAVASCNAVNLTNFNEAAHATNHYTFILFFPSLFIINSSG